MEEFYTLPRRKIRYWLFRFRNEKLEGVSSNGAPSGLKAHFEGQGLFTGWENFAVNWDIPDGEPADFVPLIAVRRYVSVWDEWDQEMMKGTKIIPLH